MRLVATYDMHYGPKGAMDAEPPIVKRGEEFSPMATGKASADEVGRMLVRNGAAMTPEEWAKRKPISDINARIVADMVAKANEASAKHRRRS